MSSTRLRGTYAAIGCAIVVIGLIVHARGTILSDAVRDVAGDALWACMMTAWVSTLIPLAPLATRCMVALTVSYAVEFSQLWHTPMLAQLRATRLGALVLGSGFDARDLLAYAAGIAGFALLDRLLVSKREVK